MLSQHHNNIIKQLVKSFPNWIRNWELSQLKEFQIEFWVYKRNYIKLRHSTTIDSSDQGRGQHEKLNMQLNLLKTLKNFRWNKEYFIICWSGKYLFPLISYGNGIYYKFTYHKARLSPWNPGGIKFWFISTIGSLKISLMLNLNSIFSTKIHSMSQFP